MDDKYGKVAGRQKPSQSEGGFGMTSNLKTPIRLASAFFVQALLFNCVFVSNVFTESVPESQDASSSSPGNVTIDFKDADIQNVLRILSYKSGVNIVAGKDVTGIVTIRLVDVPWEKALDVVLKTY